MTNDESRSSTSVTYSFDGYELDPQRRTLLRDGVQVRLTARAHDVLRFLLEHHGQLASKRQILDHVWRGVVVEDSSLTQAIHELRTVLGEKPRDRRYIVTVSGRGYQFVGEVRVLDSQEPRRIETPAVAFPLPAPTPAPAPAPAPRTSAVPMAAATFAIVVAWGLAALVLLWPSRIDSESDGMSIAEVRTAEARFFISRRGPHDIARAEAALRAALEADPQLAKAWSGLAAVHAMRMSQAGYDPAIERQRMRGAAEQALRLDPRDAQAIVRLAMFHWGMGDKAKGHRLLSTAADIAPDDPLVLAVQAGVAAFKGRLDEAIRLQQLVVRQAPVSIVDRANLAHFLYAAGRFDEAREQYQAALELGAGQLDNPVAHDAAMGIARIDVAAGRLDEARRVVAAMPDSVDRDYCLALIEHAAGNRAAADAALARVHAQASDEKAYLVAEVHAFRREFDAAFHWLEVGGRALSAQPEERHDRIWDVQNSPLLADVRQDPRWQDWVAANL
jgi:DNA-binding winged helix-turn-helix (wHTH) protein/tetratricopeptide (TPR) repeat protein